MPIPRPLRTYKLSGRYGSFLSHIDHPVELYLRTLFISDSQRESSMEYEPLTPQENSDCNKYDTIRPVSTVSVKDRRSYDSNYTNGVEEGWSFLPRKLQKWQIYICRHLQVIWNMFTNNFKSDWSADGYTGVLEGCCDCALCRCLRRVPYGTLFAAILVAGGLALLCYETLIVRDVIKDMFTGTALDPEISKEPYSRMFNEGHDISFWVLIAVVCVMGLFAILLLVFACFSNGSSGQNTCGNPSARCVGRFSTSLMIIATYFVSLVWLATVVALAMAFTFMLMLRAFCNGSVPENAAPKNTTCLDLVHYGLVSPQDDTSSSGNTTKICGSDLQEFCKQNDSIYLCVYLIMGASVIIIIGMIHFLMSLSANHTYLKVFQTTDPPRTKFGNDYRRTYTGNDYPGLQEPLNMSDETTRF